MLLVELNLLGRFPLNITIIKKIVNHILYIKSKGEESFVKQSFLVSFDLYCNDKSIFHSHACWRCQNILTYLNSILIC